MIGDRRKQIPDYDDLNRENLEGQKPMPKYKLGRVVLFTLIMIWFIILAGQDCLK